MRDPGVHICRVSPGGVDPHGWTGRLLRTIPTDVVLGDDQAREHLMDDAPAAKAWGLLKDGAGVGYVTAGKLMARKRPRPMPVYDSVVRRALVRQRGPMCPRGAGGRLWLWLHDALADPDTGIRSRLGDLKATCRVPLEVSDLRVLDRGRVDRSPLPPPPRPVPSARNDKPRPLTVAAPPALVAG